MKHQLLNKSNGTTTAPTCRHMQHTNAVRLQLPPFALSLGHQMFDFSPLQRCNEIFAICSSVMPSDHSVSVKRFHRVQ